MKKFVSLFFVLTIILSGSYFSENNSAKAQDANTVLLIHSDDTDGSTTFTDSSDSAHTVTPTGVYHETDAAKFGQSSMYFDGSSYLTMADSDDWYFGAGDFTVDFWVRRNSAGVFERVMGQYTGTELPYNSWIITFEANDSIFCAFSDLTTGTDNTQSAAGLFTDTASFHHIACVRDGTNLVMYFDGTAVATNSSATLTHGNSDGVWAIGRLGDLPVNYFSGYIDEFRISKGISRWTTNFTPPTQAYGFVGSSDQPGIEVNVADVIALDCGSDVDFGTVTPGTPVSAETTCTTTTNAENGYTLQVKREDSDTTMDHTTDDTANITDKTAWTGTGGTTDTWTGTGLGFAVYASSTGSKNTTDWGLGTACHDALNEYTGFPSSYEAILSHSSYAAAGTTTSVCYRVDIPSNQKSGSYDGVVTYQVYTNP